MKYDITKTSWYHPMIERCNQHPSQEFTVYYQNDALNCEENDQMCFDFIDQLSLLPKNLRLYVLWDDRFMDLSIFRLPEISEEEHQRELLALQDRFKVIDLQSLSPEVKAAIEKVRK